MQMRGLELSFANRLDHNSRECKISVHSPYEASVPGLMSKVVCVWWWPLRLVWSQEVVLMPTHDTLPAAEMNLETNTALL